MNKENRKKISKNDKKGTFFDKWKVVARLKVHGETSVS